MPRYTFRQNDTSGTISLIVRSGLASTISTASVVLAAVDENQSAVYTDLPATVSSVVTADDGTKGATLSAAINTDVTGTVGRYWSQFTITYSGGAIQTVPATPSGLTYEVTKDYLTASVASILDATQGYLKTQAGNGFAVGNLVRFGSGTWSKAIASADTTLADAIVVAVESSSQFRVVYLANREVTITAHGLGAAGTALYLSQVTAGLATSVRPTVYPIQQIGRVGDANTLILQSFGVEAA